MRARNITKLISGVTVALAVIGGFGCGERFPDSSQGYEFERTVLLEEGTGTWCVNCPRAAENIEDMRETHEDEFIVLALHSLAADPYSTQETEARITTLGIEAFPTIILDGVERSPDDQVATMETILSDRRTLGSPLKIELDASLTEDSVTYDVSIIVSSKIEQSLQGTLRIALVEDSIDYTDALWNGLCHVVRRIPEPAGADELTLAPGDTIVLHRSLLLDTSWGRPLTAVVWVEAQDLEVYQAASVKLTDEVPGPGDFSIGLESDTAQSVVEPGDSSRFYFTIRNHTDASLTLHIAAPDSLLELPSGWTWSIADSTQGYPSSGFDLELPAKGESQGFFLTMVSSTQGTTGKVVIVVTAGGQEVDLQSFYLGIEGSDPGDFSIEVLADSIQTVDSLGQYKNFNFTLRNHTANELTLTVDVPESLLELPDGWWWSLCDETNCYPVPYETAVPANDVREGLHITIGTSTAGAEGKVVLEVSSGGTEVDRQTFILRVGS